LQVHAVRGTNKAAQKMGRLTLNDTNTTGLERIGGGRSVEGGLGEGLEKTKKNMPYEANSGGNKTLKKIPGDIDRAQKPREESHQKKLKQATLDTTKKGVKEKGEHLGKREQGTNRKKRKEVWCQRKITIKGEERRGQDDSR